MPTSSATEICISVKLVPIHLAAAPVVRSRVLRYTLPMRSGTCDSGAARTVILAGNAHRHMEILFFAAMVTAGTAELASIPLATERAVRRLVR